MEISPVGLLINPDKPHKLGELLLHWVGNSMYAEPKFSLDNVLKECTSLAKMKMASKVELKHCYHQFPVRVSFKSIYFVL